MDFFDNISLDFVENDSVELYGSQVEYTDYDFKDKKALKTHIKNTMQKFTCPECGSHKLKGEYVEVKFGKVKMYKEVPKKGFFGKIKYSNKHSDTVFRLYSVEPREGKLFVSQGYIKCKSCQWEVKGGSAIRWMSINDIKNEFNN